MVPRFVISLDFEQAWGMEAHKAYGAERANIIGARTAIPLILALAERYSIRCTWATVGLLFFDDRDELLGALPEVRPRYADQALSPYSRMAQLGAGERTDPLHFGRSLIRLIQDCPGQEIAGHTFSHYYSLEDDGECPAFEADLAAAGRAAAKLDIQLRSIVFPRNQVREAYLPICRAAGYHCYRGTQRSSFHRSRPRGAERMWSRALRTADNYLPLTGRGGANRPGALGGLVDIAASRFLRPAVSTSSVLNRLQLRRIEGEMTAAAKTGAVFHLWWHPHNFGHATDLNLRMLKEIFQHYQRLSGDHGMTSATMGEFAESA